MPASLVLAGNQEADLCMWWVQIWRLLSFVFTEGLFAMAFVMVHYGHSQVGVSFKLLELFGDVPFLG